LILPDLFRKKTGKSFEECGIQFVILGGKDKRKLNFDNLKKLLAEFRKPEDKVITLLDNDSSLGPVNERLVGKGIIHIGRQDLEDAISPPIWKALLSKVLPTACVPTEEEIKNLIEAIPNNEVIQKSNKFHARLKAFVFTKVNENARLREQLLNSFPEKGVELGELLLAELKTKPEYWPKPVVDCFERLVG
jgi:hypothetical protein